MVGGEPELIKARQKCVELLNEVKLQEGISMSLKEQCCEPVSSSNAASTKPWDFCVTNAGQIPARPPSAEPQVAGGNPRPESQGGRSNAEVTPCTGEQCVPTPESCVPEGPPVGVQRHV